MTGEVTRGLVFLAMFAILYFLPTIVAKLRAVDNAAPTFIVNLFLGWSLIGWVVALAMGAGAKRRSVSPTTVATPGPAQSATHASGELQRLGELRTQGVLTEDEFTAAKGRMLGLPPVRP